jgi:hypothetical protein
MVVALHAGTAKVDLYFLTTNPETVLTMRGGETLKSLKYLALLVRLFSIASATVHYLEYGIFPGNAFMNQKYALWRKNSTTPYSRP